MRLLGLIFSLILLSSPLQPAQADCPPLTATQKAEEAVRIAPPTSKSPPQSFTAITVAAMGPYCAPQSTALLCKGGKGTKANRLKLLAADTALRASFEYRTDELTAGESDLWRDNVLCGDCEDYVLTLARRLHQMGVGGEYMWMAVWEPNPGMAHATLLVELEDDTIMEVSVGAGGQPQLYDPQRGKRFATIRFDGRREMQPMDGYRVDAKRFLVERGP